MEVVEHTSQGNDRQHAVITVRLYEIMPCDGGGIDMMLPKWTDECLQEDRERRMRERERFLVTCSTDTKHTTLFINTRFLLCTLLSWKTQINCILLTTVFKILCPLDTWMISKTEKQSAACCCSPQLNSTLSIVLMRAGFPLNGQFTALGTSLALVM